MLRWEFKKNGGIATRVYRVLAWTIVCYAFVAFSMIGVMGLYRLFKADVAPEWRLAAFAAVALWFLLWVSLIGWRGTKRLFPMIPSRHTRLGIGAAFVLLATAYLAFLTQFILPNAGTNVGPAAVLVFWFFTSMLAMAIAYAGLQDAAQIKHSMNHVRP